MDLQAFRAALDGIATSDDPVVVRRKSRDFHWMSPVLKEELGERRAALVVSPANEAEVVRIAAAAARHRVPLTARGAGTGTFGQAMPLAGGAIVDLTGMTRVLWQDKVAVRAEAGIRLEALDAATRPQGREQRMHPSTKRTATLGGFIAGGHAGIGTVNWGILRDRGNILGLRVVTMEETPRVLDLRGDDVNTVHHAYGVNGIITEVEMPLAPAWDWEDAVVVFDGFEAATRFAWALSAADGIVKKLVSVLAAPLPAKLKPLAPHLPPGCHAVLAMPARESREAFDGLVAEHGGRITLRVPEGGGPLATPIYEYTWGHTTLHALREDRGLTYLICIFPARDTVASILHIQAMLGESIPMHLEMKRINGQLTAEGIPLFRYEGREAMAALYARIEAAGARVANAHSYFLQNGGMKLIDEAQVAFKRSVDPHGLMNPGKIAGYADAATGATGGAAELEAKGFAY